MNWFSFWSYVTASALLAFLLVGTSSSVARQEATLSSVQLASGLVLVVSGGGSRFIENILGFLSGGLPVGAVLAVG